MKYTEKLGLKKPDPTDFYNLEDFNYNADKIDEELGNFDPVELLNNIKTVDGEGSGLDADLLDGKHATAFATSDHKHDMSDINNLNLTAENTKVKDTDNNFVSGTVEGALQELATKDKALDKRIDDNKVEIDRLKLSVADGKSKIATSVSGKGVPTNGSDSFQQMADNIDSIKTKLPILEGDVGVTEDSEGNVFGVTKFEERQMYYDRKNLRYLNWEYAFGSIRAIAVDNEGFVYACASGIASDDNNGVIKLDSEGSLIWRKNTTYAYFLDVDTKGFIYVSLERTKIVKLDSEGNIIWEFNIRDVERLIVDSENYIYATSSADYKVIKLDSEGNLIWEYSMHKALAITTDKDGNVYASNRYASSSEYNRIVKLDKEGNLLWNKNLSSSSSGYTTISVDSQDYIYVVEGDYVAKKEPNWDTVWSYSLYGLRFIAVDKQDYVYLVGNGSSASNKIVKIDSNAGLAWSYTLNYATMVYVDNQGYVYGGGYSNTSKLLKVKDNYTLEQIAVLKEREVTE